MYVDTYKANRDSDRQFKFSYEACVCVAGSSFHMFFQLPQNPSQPHTHTHTLTAETLTESQMEKPKGSGPTPEQPDSRPTQVTPIALTITTTEGERERERDYRQSAAAAAATAARTQSCVSSFFFFHHVFLFNPVSSTLLARPFVRPFPPRRPHRVQGKLKIQKVKGASSEPTSD